MYLETAHFDKCTPIFPRERPHSSVENRSQVASLAKAERLVVGTAIGEQSPAGRRRLPNSATLRPSDLRSTDEARTVDLRGWRRPRSRRKSIYESDRRRPMKRRFVPEPRQISRLRGP